MLYIGIGLTAVCRCYASLVYKYNIHLRNIGSEYAIYCISNIMSEISANVTLCNPQAVAHKHVMLEQEYSDLLSILICVVYKCVNVYIPSCPPP